MHSHAVAPESSGAFFLDMGTERCVFQAGGLRNALRASAAVHAMRRYGKSIWGVIGFWAALCPYDLVYESKVDMIFSAIALITGTATEFPNCL